MYGDVLVIVKWIVWFLSVEKKCKESELIGLTSFFSFFLPEVFCLSISDVKTDNENYAHDWKYQNRNQKQWDFLFRDDFDVVWVGESFAGEKSKNQRILLPWCQGPVTQIRWFTYRISPNREWEVIFRISSTRRFLYDCCGDILRDTRLIHSFFPRSYLCLITEKAYFWHRRRSTALK